MIFKLCTMACLVGLTIAHPVTYQDEAAQQQRVQAGPAPQYRYVQQPQAQPQYAQPQPQYAAQPQAVQYAPQPQQYAAQPQPQYAQPQPQYQQAAQPQRPRKLRPVPVAPGRVPIGSDGNPSSAEDQEYDANPSPYQFSFDVQDDLNTNYQNRKEQREGDKITGSYSVVDSDGFIRTVKYTADPLEGFKAEVTREPTDIKVIIPTPPPAGPTVRQQATQQYLQAAPQYAAPQQYRRPQAAPQAARPRQPQYAEQPSEAQYAASPAQQQQYAAAPAQYAVAAPQRSKTAAYFAPQPAAQYQQYAQQ